jgi:hypothetical protein
MIGDSHAEYLLPRFAEQASRAGYDTIAYIEFGCPAALGVDTSSSSKHCAATREKHLADLNGRADIAAVILISRWNYYETGAAWDRKNNWLLDPAQSWMGQSRGPVRNHELLSAGITQLVDGLRSDLAVGLLLPIPQPDFDPRLRAEVAAHAGRGVSMSFSRVEYEQETARFLETLQDVSQQTAGRMQIIDPAPLLCEAALCSTVGDGRVFYRDASHMTDAGAERLEPLFRMAIRDLVGDSSV